MEDRGWRIGPKRGSVSSHIFDHTKHALSRAKGSTKEENILFRIRCPLRYPVFVLLCKN